MQQTNDDPFKANVLRWLDEQLTGTYEVQGKQAPVWRVHYERNFATGFSVCTIVHAPLRKTWLYGWGKAPELHNELKDPDQMKIQALCDQWRKEVS